jgi:GABA permease
MGAYLVVAHRTLVEDHLLDHARSLCEAGDCRFHLVVPVTHPRDHAWTDGEVTAAARRRLDEGIVAFHAIGAEVTGEVGDANPVYAVATALRAAGDHDWDGIIVSTLPPGVSRWLGLDVVSRVKREFDLPVTHLVAESEPAGA